MDHLPAIFLCVSVLCLCTAFLWYQMERIERAGVRNVAEAEREALRRLQRDTERHNRDLRDAVRNLLTIKPLPVRQMAEPKPKRGDEVTVVHGLDGSKRRITTPKRKPTKR